jgi:hypothetical protein
MKLSGSVASHQLFYFVVEMDFCLFIRFSLFLVIIDDKNKKVVGKFQT